MRLGVENRICYSVRQVQVSFPVLCQKDGSLVLSKWRRRGIRLMLARDRPRGWIFVRAWLHLSFGLLGFIFISLGRVEIEGGISKKVEAGITIHEFGKARVRYICHFGLCIVLHHHLHSFDVAFKISLDTPYLFYVPEEITGALVRRELARENRNAFTMSLSSATSGEIIRVAILEACYPEVKHLGKVSMNLDHSSSGIISKQSLLELKIVAGCVAGNKRLHHYRNPRWVLGNISAIVSFIGHRNTGRIGGS
ncbi:hypothetical protein Tco_0973579 [Tanacetum coccineum]